jgi:hypothetical protein
MAPLKSARYDHLLRDLGGLLEQARRTCIRSVNTLMTATCWEIGGRIVEFEQGDQNRAGSGAELLERLAQDVAARFGRGFSRRNLQDMRTPHQVFLPAQVASTPSNETGPATIPQITSALSSTGHFSLADLARAFPLPWSHYVLLIRRSRSPEAFAFYHAGAPRNKAAVLAKGAKPQLGENPPVGVILCSGKGESLARFPTEALPSKVLARNTSSPCPRKNPSPPSWRKPAGSWNPAVQARDLLASRGPSLSPLPFTPACPPTPNSSSRSRPL